MSFAFYRVEADYAQPGLHGDVLGPGWYCQTYREASELASRLRLTRDDLCNVVVNTRLYR